MNTILYSNKKLYLPILFFLIPIMWSCSSSIPEDGILPEDYAWAYGWWRVTENSGTDYEDTYDLILNGSTYQSNRIGFFYEEEGFYPVYTMPKISFSIVEDEETKSYLELGENEIGLATRQLGDYDLYIVLNKKEKTVSQNAKCVKVKEKPDPVLIEEYVSKLASIPIEGQWKILRTVRGWNGDFVNYINIEHSNDNILTKKGNVIEFESGNLLSYNSDSDRLTVSFIGIEEGENTFTYKRYDPKQEISDMLVGKSFSHMSEGLFPNTEYLTEFSFSNNDVCIMSLYEYDALTSKRLLERKTEKWRIIDNNTISITYEGEEYKYKIGRNCIISDDPNRYVYD